MTAALLPFLRLDSPRNAVAPKHPEARLGELPLTVLVGVTGVGKSTALGALSGANLRVLPDRREVTDAVMILPLTKKAVSDREERFKLTAQYRQTHPGGMAQALGSLIADTRHWGTSPVFDGLRGLDEVQYAAEYFPNWRFVALSAPDLVRVKRLLGRADHFDQVQTNETGDLHTALSELKGSLEVFTPKQLAELAGLVAAGYAAGDILAKTKIVVSERRNYDPQAAEAYLKTLPSQRALLLDTVALNPDQIAQAVQEWA